MYNINVMKYFAKSLLDRLLIGIGIYKLRHHQRQRLEHPKEIVAAISSFPHCGPYHLLGAMQNCEELVALAELVRLQRPKRTLEIGTASGGTLFVWSHYTSEQLISVDLPRGAWGGGYEKARVPFYRAFAENNPGLKVNLIRGASCDFSTLAEVKLLLGNRKLDFLFIDGDHTQEGVQNDLYSYLPLVEDGGLVALHDIEAHNFEPNCHVNQVWNMIRDSWRGQAIISSSKPRHLGIGWFIWRTAYLDSLPRMMQNRI